MYYSADGMRVPPVTSDDKNRAILGNIEAQRKCTSGEIRVRGICRKMF